MPKITIAKKPFKGKPVGSEIELTDRQARLLTKMGRAQYMTRDMVAASPAVVQEAKAPAPQKQPEEPAPVVAQQEPQQQQERAGEEVDVTGATWDERLHSNAKAKNLDGTWRKRPGARFAESGE